MSISPYLKRTLFTRPFPLLPLAVFIVLVLSFIGHPNSPIHTLELSDTDDYMRLNQIMNWLAGQSWYDLSHPRLSPGEHVVVYWSRLVDLPIAALAWPLLAIMSLKNAIMLAALIVPLALFGLLLVPMVTAMVRPLVPRNRANLAAVMLLFALPIITNFAPGRVDHHGYQIIIAGFGFLCLHRLWLCPQRWQIALVAALSFACGLWIGGEAFPSLILFAGCLALLASWRGGLILRNSAIFGASLALFTALILPLARRPEEWALREMTWFSSAYVIFTALLGGVFVLSWLLGRHTDNRWLRLILIISSTFMAATAFFLLVPKAVLGPYADFETLSGSIVLQNVSEAQPLFTSLHIEPYDLLFSLHRALPIISRFLFLPFVGLMTIAWQIIRTRGKRRIIWFITGVYLLPFVLLTLFWQLRVFTYVSLFTITPITWLAWRWWNQISEKLSGRSQFWAEILAFSVLGLFPVVLIPGLLSAKPLMPDILLFTADRPQNTCRLGPVTSSLNDPTIFGDHPRVIMNTMNDGPALLFRTPHSVISAPYNVRGNQDSLDFFSARDEQLAQNILRRRHVDLVVFCRHVAPFYATINKQSIFNSSLSMDANGNLDVISDRNHPALIELLLRNKPPEWLKPVEVLFNKDYLIYEISLPVTLAKG